MASVIKTGLASLVHRSGAGRLLGAITGRGPTVFGYHRVVDDYATHAAYSIAPMLVSRAMFERHLDWILGRFHVVALDEFASRSTRQSRAGRPPAAITFDDGYRDVYEQALPLLIRKGVPATVFVVSEFVGTSRVLLHDELYLRCQRAFALWPSPLRALSELLVRLDIALPMSARVEAAKGPLAAVRVFVTTLSQAQIRRICDALDGAAPAGDRMPDGLRALTWDMVDEMIRAGVAIGSHTKSHVLLTNESAARVRDETLDSRLQLERRIGSPIACFAYPDGRFDPASVRAVAAAGYSIAVTTCRHRDRELPRLTIPRVLLWEHSSVDAHGRFSPPILSCHVNGAFDLLSGCRQPHVRTAADDRHDQRHLRYDHTYRARTIDG
jgi:peptidoglycan/xylan/chitin deacetylase (PgdA/CDA1 family)